MTSSNALPTPSAFQRYSHTHPLYPMALERRLGRRLTPRWLRARLSAKGGERACLPKEGERACLPKEGRAGLLPKEGERACLPKEGRAAPVCQGGRARLSATAKVPQHLRLYRRRPPAGSRIVRRHRDRSSR